jgi:hypothetical protein
MKRTILTLACLTLLLLLPAALLAQPSPSPGDTAPLAPAFTDIGQDLEDLIDAIRTGSAIAIAAAVITLLVSLFKSPLLGSIVSRIPVRWRIAIPIVLGGIAGILYDLMAAVPTQEAVLVGVFAGPVAVFGHELVAEALLGGVRTRHPHLKRGHG